MCDGDDRVKSADSPLSAMAGVKLLPEVQVYARSCSSISSHVIMFLLLSCAVEGGSRASLNQTSSSPGRCVYLFAVAVVVHMFHMQHGMVRSV